MISEDQQGGHQLIIPAVVPRRHGCLPLPGREQCGRVYKGRLRVDRECTFGCEDSGRAGILAVRGSAGLEDYQPNVRSLRSGRIWGWKSCEWELLLICCEVNGVGKNLGRLGSTPWAQWVVNSTVA